jgi:predicted Ser/Thr protein kinase
VNQCQICGTQNPESAEACLRCGAALNASPTMSISSEVAPATPPKSPSQPAARGFAPGSLIGERYRVVSLLGRGGMGEVYGADDLKLGQRVALKFLPAHRTTDSSWRDQFYAEVRMARQVSHPNVCRVYDVGESDGRLFLSMEFVDGEDLASLLRRIGRLPDDKAVEVAQQLCAGLTAAHGAGVLHRDLKPSNVMLDGKGRARITDFGLAIAATDAAREKSPAGTFGYIAPELLEGAPATVQSDVYALGLVLYELFTGKKAYEASSLAELHRKQSETNPTPPSSVVKNLDPAVERAILRCLDRDPAQRPRSAQSVAAALPGGDPLAAALAAGETPSPEMVAAAGPQGSLRPAIAWACLVASLILILGASMFLAPGDTDWGLAPMPKSPEVLADRAQELAKSLGYPSGDRADWIETDQDYLQYAAAHPDGKDWKRTSAEQVWPSTVNFWYRQSPQWMMPAVAFGGPLHVTPSDPPQESADMVTVRFNMQGNLLFLRAIPSQVDLGGTSPTPDWSLLFAAAGLDKTRFAPASPKWAPPDAFDSRADWEGRLPDHPDMPLHISAASFHGVPVYFQVIAPWDKPRRGAPIQIGPGTSISSLVTAALLIGVVGLGAVFARWNLRQGRGDSRGALRLMAVVAVMDVIYALTNYHLVPRTDYIIYQFVLLAIPLFFSLILGIGYAAVEPYARRYWPTLMVSWQRLLSGRLRDPLVGRDILFGVLAGAISTAFLLGVNTRVGLTETFPVFRPFGAGAWASVGAVVFRLSQSGYTAMERLALLTITTAVLRKKWLALLVTGLLIIGQDASPNAIDVVLTVVYAAMFMFVFVRLGLIATTCFLVVFNCLAGSPPLDFSQWYAGRAMIGLLLPVAMLLYGFYISMGSQPIFGSALKED